MQESTSFSPKDLGQITTYQSGIVQATAHRLINRIVSDYLEAYDLTAMHWFIVGHIYDSGDGGMRLTDLARLLQTTLPYTTTAINFLESRGMVTKKGHKTDNRTKLVSISSSYRPVVEEIETGLREEMRTQLYKNDHISRGELQTYIAVLYKIVQPH